MKKKNIGKSIKKTIMLMISPYITFLFIIVFLVVGLFMGVEELWEEFTSQNGIKEITYSSKGFVWPLPGYRDISSDFGNRFHPIKKVESFHDGIDIPAPQGTEVVSPSDGIVTSVYDSSSVGKSIEIESDNYKFVFHHLYTINVKENDKVKKGQVIGGVGSTGTLSTGNHLHFTVYEEDELINPLNLVNFNNVFEDEEVDNSIENETKRSVNNIDNNIY